jgi:hypothetical protein
LKRLVLLFFFPLLIPVFSFGQNDSCSLRISLLTCAPGEELYSTFGHTALRVQDPSLGIDQVYNYGTFEFGPDFYMKFIRGKLLYFLSVEEYGDFMYQYEAQSRSVQEQVLRLDCHEKQKLMTALQINALEENKYYRYDFLFDNCTTRAGDMVAKNTEPEVVFHDILDGRQPSFRDQIHEYLDAGKQHWSKLGIDLLLGAKLDRKSTNREAMFLPDYLLKGFDRARVQGQPLSDPPRTILSLPSPLKKNNWFTPMLVFLILLLLVMAGEWSNNKRMAQALLIFDFLFFFLLGLTGILLLFMWFGSDHLVCSNNYNLLWALPTHSVMAFFVHSRKSLVGHYFRLTAWLALAMILAWFFLPQEMNPGFLPVLVLILFRSWKRSKKLKT